CNLHGGLLERARSVMVEARPSNSIDPSQAPPNRVRCACDPRVWSPKAAPMDGGTIASTPWRPDMDDDALATSIRKFLKVVGVSSQREIERAVAEASAAG